MRSRLIPRGLLYFALSVLCLCAGTARAGEVRVVENLTYKAGENLSAYEQTRCKLDLYLPVGVESFPAMLWFHGGNITAGDKDQGIQTGVGRSLAARGIAVAVVNYRLSPQVSFPAYIDDAAASVAWVLEHISGYGGDPARVFVSGHSAGGYLAAMAVLDATYLKALGHGPGELAGMIPISGQMVTHTTVRNERGQPETQPVVDEAAPLFHVNAAAPPWLAIAGSEDLPARPEENRYFVAALKAVGHTDVNYLEFEGRNHGTIVSRIPEEGDPVAQAIIDFINR